MAEKMKRPMLGDKKRIVVKVGSSSITYENTGKPNYSNIEKLVRELCDLKNRGYDICLVSSGAIAVGREVMHQDKVTSNSQKQALAAIGQASLIMTYKRLFAQYEQSIGQVLLTKNTTDHPEQLKNAKNTFEALFKMGAIPIVNENDALSTYEIKFGDNDTLSATVTEMTGADLLIIISDVDGLYTDDPRSNPEAELVEYVEKIDGELLDMAKGTESKVGTGGMQTKLKAALMATKAGADMIIVNSSQLDVLYKILDNTYVGTLFKAE